MRFWYIEGGDLQPLVHVVVKQTGVSDSETRHVQDKPNKECT